MSVVGFDFGNETCVVAVARRRGIEVLQNEIGKRKTATMVAFNGKQRHIGDDASSQFMSNFKNSVINSKRLLGKSWEDPDREKEERYHNFKTVNKDGCVAIEVRYSDQSEVFTPEQVTGAMFQKLKQIAEAGLDNQRVVDCVISCPPSWNDVQRHAMLDAANIAGLNVLRLMNETTAVALQYGILRPLPKDEDRKVLFVDCGQSATKTSLVSFQQGKLEVLATASDDHLGGRDFDWALMQYFAKYIQEKYKLDVLSNAKATLKLNKECKRVKTMLSANTQAPFNVEYIMNDTDVSGSITRDEFEQSMAGPLARLLVPCQQVLEAAGVAKEDLYAIEVVGGTSRVPCVQKVLTEFFGKQLSKTCDSDESVARGCALQCAMLSPSFRVREFEVHDITPYAVQLSWGAVGASEAEESTVVFAARNPIPSVKMITFKDRVESFQLEARYVGSVPVGTAPVLGRWVISGLPATTEKTQKIKVRVKLDLHGVITVRSAQLLEELPEEEEEQPAEDETAAMKDDEKPEADAAGDTAAPEAGADADAAAQPMEGVEKEEEKPKKKKKKRVKRVDLQVESQTTGGLGEKVLAGAFEREAEMANQDKVIAETNELRNALESYCLEMRSKVREGGELAQFISRAEADTFCSALSAGEDWLYDDGFDAQKSEYKKRLDELKVTGTPVERRRYEQDNRNEYIASLKSTIQQLQQLAASQDEKYAHIEAEERQKVTDKCAEVDAWFVEVSGKQDRLPSTEDPAFTCKELYDKAQQLNTFCTPIMNKPKPAPKKEEKKPEATPENKDGEAAMEDDEKPADAQPEAAAEDDKMEA